MKSQKKRKIITSNHGFQRFLDLKPHIDVVGISCVKSGCHFLAFKLGLCACLVLIAQLNESLVLCCLVPDGLDPVSTLLFRRSSESVGVMFARHNSAIGLCLTCLYRLSFMMRAEQLQTELNMHVLKEKMQMLSFTTGYISQLQYHVISHTFKCHSVLRDADSERKHRNQDLSRVSSKQI